MTNINKENWQSIVANSYKPKCFLFRTIFVLIFLLLLLLTSCTTTFEDNPNIYVAEEIGTGKIRTITDEHIVFSIDDTVEVCYIYSYLDYSTLECSPSRFIKINQPYTTDDKSQKVYYRYYKLLKFKE